MTPRRLPEAQEKRPTLDQMNSDDLDQLHAERDGCERMYLAAMSELGRALDRLDHIRQLHHPAGVVAAAEAGIEPDCATCGLNRWPCPTYNAITEPAPGPAATQATEASTDQL